MYIVCCLQYVFESEKTKDPHHKFLEEIQKGIKLKKAPEIRDRSRPNLKGTFCLLQSSPCLEERTEKVRGDW